jgi:methionine sulfoxide reductase heme-binding subunit
MALAGRRVNVQYVEWLIARGAGFTAFLLLTAAVTAGLALSLRLKSPRWPAIITKDLHQHLTTLSLWMLGLHVTMLVIDTKSGVSAAAAVVPLRSAYRPWATSVGIIAMYTVLTLIISTKLKSRIGHKRWRKLHYLAFVAYGAALLHGLVAGTDAGATWAGAIYITSAVLVGGLTIKRILGSGERVPVATSASAGRTPLPAAVRSRETATAPPSRRPT